MRSKAGRQFLMHSAGRVLASLPIGLALLFLAAAILISYTQKSPLGLSRPDANHVQILKEKQSAWLSQHPLLMKVSQIKFDGIPGDMVTNACWHLMKAASGHRYQPAQVVERSAQGSKS